MNKYLEKIAASRLKMFGVSTAIGAGLGALTGAISGSKHGSWSEDTERAYYCKLLKRSYPGINLGAPDVKAHIEQQVKEALEDSKTYAKNHTTKLSNIGTGAAVNGVIGGLTGALIGGSLAFSK